MTLNLLKGYPDYIGKRWAIAGFGSGPASYVTGGDPISVIRFGTYIDVLAPAMSVSGTYIVYPVPNAVGNRATWKAKWVVLATGVEVAGAVNLSAESVQLGGYGGQY